MEKIRPNIRFMVDFWGPEAAGGHSRPKRNFFKNFRPWPVHWNFLFTGQSVLSVYVTNLCWRSDTQIWSKCCLKSLRICGSGMIFGVPRPPEAIPGRNGEKTFSISPPGWGPMYAIVYPDFGGRRACPGPVPGPARPGPAPGRPRASPGPG